jgi:serine protease inhibitor
MSNDFEDIIQKYYDIDLYPVDFRDVKNTLRNINSEGSKKLNGKIKVFITRDNLYKV